MNKKDGTAIGQKEFAMFKEECERWRKIFGLMDWKLHYYFEELDDAIAGIKHDFEGKIASVFLNPFQERIHRRDARASVKRSARHEMLHLLLAELNYLNGRRIVSENIWDAAEHGVIRRLESAFGE